MKKLLLLLLFFVIVGHSLFAQTWRRLGGWGNKLTGISWVTDEIGFVSGEQIILKTIDGGLSWTELEPPTDNKMLAVDFFNQNRGLIVGENGQVYLTTDGGSTWQLKNLATAATLKKVKFLNENRAYIVGEKGEVFRSTNGGQNWSKQQVNNTTDLNSLYFVNSDTGYIATSSGQVLKTFNGGNAWTLGNTGESKSLNDIYFVSGKTGYAVGEKGIILKTIDAAQSWTVVNSGTERDLISVSFNKTNSNAGVIVGNSGTLLRTVNGGLTFDGININNSENYAAASFRTGSNVVFAVGTNGFVISSINSGGSWTLRLSGVDNDYTGTKFKTANLGYIIGKAGRFLVTSNGGTSLVDRSRPLSIAFNGLSFPTNNFGYLAGENGIVLRTGNSGSNWTSLNLNTEVNINGLFFFANSVGYVVGNGGFISSTTDSGVNWKEVTGSNTNVDLRDIAYFDFAVGIVIGKNGYLGWSFGGQQWEKITLPTTENLNAMKLLDVQNAIVVGDKGSILKSSDQGKTWKKITTSFTQNMTAIDFLDESVGFIAGEKGLMLRTIDAGETWERMPTGTFQNFSGISFGDLSRGYAVGAKGTLFSYSCQVPETPTVIFGESNICLSQQIYTVQSDLLQGEEFDWRVDGGTILEGQGTNKVIVRWDSPGRNAVLVRGKNNCGNGSTRGLEVLVSTEPVKIPEITGEGAVCLNSFAEYEVFDVPGTDFLWELTGGLILEGQGTSKVKVQWTGLNAQQLKVTPKNPCGNGLAFSKSILVQNVPELPSVISGPVMVALSEEEYQVVKVPNVNYQWSVSDGGGEISEGQGTSKVKVTWKKEGNFDLIVSPMNGCNKGEERSLKVNVNLITSIGEENFDAKIELYPNPSQGNLNLRLLGLGDVQEISIVNALGQTLNQIKGRPGVFEYAIYNLPRGLHTVAIRTREREYYRKIIVN
ncbi:YCF48-related protein [Rhodonellum sp.]|uniref:YCF48-related protein n=1 Tax=Rhodonellum sp. TaxID=2231180 RepID=UPI002727621D|nr:YCF48-related protein [Rhodonellum sp.]MDO9552583.1 YCF48-related protein [Rhodonellum sp.]